MLCYKSISHFISVLESLAGKGSLRGLNVVISHVKYSLDKGDSLRSVIASQLEKGNTPGVRFIIPEQGEVIALAQ